MTNIFVDCDDTLIMYQTGRYPNPYGLRKGSEFRPNFKLIGALLYYHHTHPKDNIYLWSGGGRNYARECAIALNMFSFTTMYFTKDEKNFHLIKDGDIVIDDDNWHGLRTHTPFNWPETMS